MMPPTLSLPPQEIVQQPPAVYYQIQVGLPKLPSTVSLTVPANQTTYHIPEAPPTYNGIEVRALVRTEVDNEEGGVIRPVPIRQTPHYKLARAFLEGQLENEDLGNPTSELAQAYVDYQDLERFMVWRQIITRNFPDPRVVGFVYATRSKQSSLQSSEDQAIRASLVAKVYRGHILAETLRNFKIWNNPRHLNLQHYPIQIFLGHNIYAVGDGMHRLAFAIAKADYLKEQGNKRERDNRQTI